MRFRFLILALFVSMQFACSDIKDKKSAKKSTYIKPSIDYKGNFRKGHFRKSVSTNKNAIKNQSRSRYYYQTKGKYKKKK